MWQVLCAAAAKMSTIRQQALQQLRQGNAIAADKLARDAALQAASTYGPRSPQVCTSMKYASNFNSMQQHYSIFHAYWWQ